MINLSKGSSINLTKNYAGVTKYRFGLAWDLKNGMDADLDALVLELDSSGRCIGADWLVGYPSGDPGRDNHNNITFTTPSGKTGFKDPEGAVMHYGDARSATVSENGDDEVIEVDLSKVNQQVSEVLLVVSIYEPAVHFDKIGCPSVSVYKGDSEVAELSYELNESFPEASVVEIARIKKNAGAWELEALGEGVPSLERVLVKYKLT